MTSIYARLFFSLGLLIAANHAKAQKASQGLIGHWPLTANANDISSYRHQAQPHGKIDFKGSEGGEFNGVDTWIEANTLPATFPGKGDFTLSAWIKIDDNLDDAPGDIISRYDAKQRRGFHLSIKSSASPTSQSSYRQITFGIDDARESGWNNYGKPGNALLAFGLAEFKGELYAGICQAGPTETGKVYKLGAGNQWTDCGAPDESNSVMALAVFNNELYAATGHYRIGGSSLPESENTVPGGRIYRYQSPGKWVEVGNLSLECIGAMAVYNGKLYASSMYAPGGLFRYEGDHNWVSCGAPFGKRAVNLLPYNGYLYATSWDHGIIYRYNGIQWEDCGAVGDNTQNYAFNVFEGKLYTATWPSGRVFRFDGLNRWTDVGRLGKEMEVMAMMTHNGKMLAGTLPLAEVYRYEGDTLWTRMDQIDRTPDVRYRRAWTMAEHQGMVFCSTLPSGNIFGYEAGKSVSMSESLPSGWHHITAVKTRSSLRLYLNGSLVAEKAIPGDHDYDLSTNMPLKIGFGSNDYLKGRMKDLRIHSKALSKKEIKKLVR